MKPSSFTQVTVDTTVQEKAIAFPTDGRLYHKGRVWLVRLAKCSGIELRLEIEQLFGNARLLGVSLGVAGILILAAAVNSNTAVGELNYRRALWIGAIQGVCLPFRGFSRSGATISSGLLLGVQRQRAEEFSFALAVILTPAVVAKEGYRFFQAHVGVTVDVGRLLVPSVLGMVLSFAAGLGALCWLSTWLARGRWHLFGLYCLAAAAVVSFAG